eukprot:4796590-Pyramimonas_sp.AAC.2
MSYWQFFDHGYHRIPLSVATEFDSYGHQFDINSISPPNHCHATRFPLTSTKGARWLGTPLPSASNISFTDVTVHVQTSCQRKKSKLKLKLCAKQLKGGLIHTRAYQGAEHGIRTGISRSCRLSGLLCTHLRTNTPAVSSWNCRLPTSNALRALSGNRRGGYRVFTSRGFAEKVDRRCINAGDRSLILYKHGCVCTLLSGCLCRVILGHCHGRAPAITTYVVAR